MLADEAARWFTKMVQCLTEEQNFVGDCYFEGDVEDVKRLDIRGLEFRVRGKMMFIRGKDDSWRRHV